MIGSYFITAGYNKEEFVLPQDLEATIYCLPDHSDFCTPDNKDVLYSYLDKERISIAFVCYIDGAFFSDCQGKPCKFVYWSHANPFWEHRYDVERGQMQAKHSIKRWIQWKLLGGEHFVCSESYRRSIEERYRRDIEIFDRYIVLCPEYAEEICRTLSLSHDMRAKLLSMTNTIDIVPDPLLEKRKEVAFVSRIELVQKRFDRMLLVWYKAMQYLPDWTLKIYGSGHDEWIMYKEIKRLGLERVEYCGYTTDLRQIYDNSAVVCLTSTFEGWPMVLVEAQTHGCVPITFDSYAAARSIVGKNGEYGFLIPAFDISAYANQLIRACTDDHLRTKLQSACLVKSREYAKDINDIRWDKLFQDLLT